MWTNQNTANHLVFRQPLIKFHKNILAKKNFPRKLEIILWKIVKSLPVGIGRSCDEQGINLQEEKIPGLKN